jgi:hypothetical protein
MDQIQGIQKAVAATVASAVALGLLFGLLDAETGDKLITAVPLVFAPILVWATRNKPVA